MDVNVLTVSLLALATALATGLGAAAGWELTYCEQDRPGSRLLAGN